jgi:hypothetical protein
MKGVTDRHQIGNSTELGRDKPVLKPGSTSSRKDSFLQAWLEPPDMEQRKPYLHSGLGQNRLMHKKRWE